MNEARIADRVAASMIAARFTIPPFTQGRAEKSIQKRLPVLERALANKHIWNVDYKDLKDSLNRAVEISRDEMWKQFWRTHNKDETPDGPYYDSPTGLHLMPSFLKKLQRYDGVFKKEVTDWAEAWLPYAEAIKSLKPYIEKGRKIDPNKPVKERYEAPRTSTSGLRLVKDALEKVVAAQAGKLSNTIAAKYVEVAKKFLKEREPTQTPFDFFKRDVENRDVVYRMVEVVSGNESMPKALKEYAMRSDGPAIARGFADTQVKEIVERYLYKNTNKIGSVVERKGGLEKIKVAYGSLRGWGFAGELICQFADETRFTVRNKVVYHFNYNGNDYVQFPTTFHDVIWPDGKRSAMLSEKQMNEDWAPAGKA